MCAIENLKVICFTNAEKAYFHVVFQQYSSCTIVYQIKSPRLLCTALDREGFLITDKHTCVGLGLYSMCHFDFLSTRQAHISTSRGKCMV